MKFDRPADYFVLFELPDPEKSLAVGFWNYGQAASDPFEFLTKYAERTTSIIADKGYTMYKSDRQDFMSFVVVKNDIDAERAIEAAQTWLKTLVVEVVKSYDPESS
jgi:hypothetical protein